LKYANRVNLHDVIETVLDEDYKKMIDALKVGIVEGVGGSIGSLYETIAGVNTLAGGYTGLIQRVGIDPFISRWVNQAITPNVPDAETAWFMQRIGKLTPEDYAAYLAQDGWSSDFKEALEWTWNRQPPVEMLLELRRRGVITFDEFKYALRWYRFNDAKIANIGALAVQYPEPYRLAEIHTKGLTSNDEYIRAQSYFGLESDWAWRWAEAQVKYPDFVTALALLRRGDINEETFTLWMRRNQIYPEQASVMLKLKEAIPPIQDLIRFAVREAYLDHDPEKQYPFMVDVAKKMGLTEEASSWYWWAHWDRIPVNLMYANYHRGLWD